MATILAQPILQLSLSHPEISLQASYSSPKMIPIPQEEEASTQNSMGDTEGGLDNKEPQKLVDSWEHHHAMSDNTLRLGVRQMNGDDRKLKEAAKQDMAGR